jgi:hypothetical protein
MAGESGASGCIEFSPDTMTMDAGGYSLTTAEHLTQSAAYFEAIIEAPDGKAHPAFGTKPQGVYVFKTMSGRLIVRVLTPWQREWRTWVSPY